MEKTSASQGQGPANTSANTDDTKERVAKRKATAATTTTAKGKKKQQQQQVEVIGGQKTENEESPTTGRRQLRRHSTKDDNRKKISESGNGPSLSSVAVALDGRGSKSEDDDYDEDEDANANANVNEEQDRASKIETKPFDNADDGNYDELENLGDKEDYDNYESSTSAPAEVENFPLSRYRLNKADIVYSNKNVLCLRIREKTV